MLYLDINMARSVYGLTLSGTIRLGYAGIVASPAYVILILFEGRKQTGYELSLIRREACNLWSIISLKSVCRRKRKNKASKINEHRIFIREGVFLPRAQTKAFNWEMIH